MNVTDFEREINPECEEYENDCESQKEAPDKDRPLAAISHPARILSTPPGYSSGFVLILREPHAEHFMCLLTSGTGVSGGSGTVAGLTSRSWSRSQQ